MELQLQEKKNDKGEVMFVLDTAALETAIKDGTASAIQSEIKTALEKEKVAIFNGGDGDLLDREGKTVVDTSYFYKDYTKGRNRMHITGDPIMDGMALGRKMVASGGPFLRLSPAMEKFANCLRQGFDVQKLMSQGISIMDYNKEIANWNKKDTLSGLSTTDAGALVPIEFLATVIEFATGQSQILPRLWRIPMGSETLRIPTLSQSAGSYFGGIVLYHPDELEEKSITKPSFSYKDFTAKKLIGLIPLSDSLIRSSSINIINYCTGLSVRAFQYKTEGEVISGTGLNNQMTGILSDSSIVKVSRTTVSTVKYDDFIKLESGLDENFQDLTYLTRRNTFNTVKLQKSTTGQPVWQLLLPFSGGGPQFNDYPVIKTRNIPAIGTEGDVILGDLGFYIWAVAEDMKIDLSREAYFIYDATALRFVMTQDGKPGVSIAFACLDNVPES